MMNNKGQTLVLFVLLLPFVMLLIVYLTELANVSITKKKADSDIKTAIEYALSNISDTDIKSKTQKLVDNNVNGRNAITIKDSVVSIQTTIKIKNIFPKMFDMKEINIKHTGYIENNKKIIE